MTQLSVNLNKVALLRNIRSGVVDLRRAASVCIDAGARGITLHPRPDQRHARYSDVYDMAAFVAEREGVELNIEGNPIPDFLSVVCQARPAQCTLVPDAPDALTSDHGWDVETSAAYLQPIIAELKGRGIRVSLFLDPDLRQIQRAAGLGVDRIELYTEPYARAADSGDANDALMTYAAAAREASLGGLGVNAGHDLNLENLGPFCRAVPGVLEVSIGHALIGDALSMGLDAAVRSYVAVLDAREMAP
ncbi:MAG TPA: pyridoxine 5'-phosphate synthase [Steroidobacteraceae bacterium]